MGRVQQINQDSEFAPAITGAGSKLVVVDFFATWCGPCVRIAPFVDSLSTKYPNAVFLKVDVDKCKSVAQACGIRAMPTFQFFKNGAKIDDMTGADPAGLERKVQAHIGSGGSSFEGAGHVLGGASSSGQAGAAAATKSPVPGFYSLAPVIPTNGVQILNALGSEYHAILDDNETAIESDADQQLIISLRFNQGVNVHSLQFKAPADGRAPKTIRLYANRLAALSFDDTDSAPPRRAKSSSSPFHLRQEQLKLIGATVRGSDLSKLAETDHDHKH
ncbi:thioredoxin [Capsaspora owczarzaki ATCC 30864]|uniref:thioredoxin n=1 Tax=Capsaspora owczarzaki (strain ATCC 30864) TaxID=595528 RepID=UPI0003522776|nr:thioredoxin [Capsaspora owczarzaki ATCC 30864]|eukprot:XP_004345172.2 thioredoxin [Capsaspora owczarzaki ATCC 30864]